MATCPFCGGELVVRPKMVHDTRKGTRASVELRAPRRRYLCSGCKRVVRSPG